MSVNPCIIGGQHKGPSPVKDADRPAIWKWAKENSDFKSRAATGKAINDHFFGGRAPDAWVNDIIGGRKTAFRHITNEMWRKSYDRANVVRQAQDLTRLAGTSKFGRVAQAGWSAARTLETMGHGIVFPVTHAGDLIFRPASWGTFFKGVARAYKGAYNKDYAIARMADMQRDPLFDLAMRSGVEVGPRSHAFGILGEQTKLSKKLGDTPGLRRLMGSAGRSWDMLGVMRFELWKKAMSKNITAGMTDAEHLDFGKNFAEWANDATGAGKGKIANIGGEVLFGPKLTQAKVNRLSELVKTPADFANWRNLTPGEQAVAWKRLSGATQYIVTRLGFLAVNAGFLAATGNKQKVNVTDPNAPGFMAFKGMGLEGTIPGIGTEIKVLAKILNLAYHAYVPKKTVNKITSALTEVPLLGMEPGAYKPRVTGPEAFWKIAQDYGSAKFHPSVHRAAEVMTGKDWMGRPMPWSSDKGKHGKERLQWSEYAFSIGPIPLQGPSKYVYDQLQSIGMSKLESIQIIKGLVILGGGGVGGHVKEDRPKKHRY